jgi:hypothetical protein
MLRLGVSLPALLQLLGHKDIRMTLRYLQINQQDLQREFHVARKNAAHRHLIPPITAPDISSQLALMSLGSAKHSQQHAIPLEMYRQLADDKTRCKLQRPDKRLRIRRSGRPP